MKRRPPSRSGWHPPLEAEDVALWDDVKKSVKRLPKAKPEKLLPVTKPASSKTVKEKPAPAPLEKKSAPKMAVAAPLSSFDRTSLRKIKSGKMRIDDTLDLHGFRLTAAHTTLEGFILSARARGCKLVLVITGKGDRFSKEEGVLRREVPRWLKDTGLRHAISGFSKAATAHGGEGAFYVRLRARR